MIAKGAREGIWVGVGPLGLVFPDVSADGYFTSCGSVEVSNGGVFPHSTRVEEVADGSSRVLATNDHLIGIPHHPDSWMMAEEPKCPECKHICKPQPVEVVSAMGMTCKKKHTPRLHFSTQQAPHSSELQLHMRLRKTTKIPSLECTLSAVGRWLSQKTREGN
jgi:hypothetical protein